MADVFDENVLAQTAAVKKGSQMLFFQLLGFGALAIGYGSSFFASTDLECLTDVRIKNDDIVTLEGCQMWL